MKETCIKIEQALPNTEKKKMRVDVDGTIIQTYSLPGKDINVFDDYDVGAVFIQSGIDLKNMNLEQ